MADNVPAFVRTARAASDWGYGLNPIDRKAARRDCAFGTLDLTRERATRTALSHVNNPLISSAANWRVTDNAITIIRTNRAALVLGKDPLRGCATRRDYTIDVLTIVRALRTTIAFSEYPLIWITA